MTPNRNDRVYIAFRDGKPVSGTTSAVRAGFLSATPGTAVVHLQRRYADALRIPLVNRPRLHGAFSAECGCGLFKACPRVSPGGRMTLTEHWSTSALDACALRLESCPPPPPPNPQTPRIKCGVIFRLASFWIGAHWSPYNRRWCINLVPGVTFWITLKGGNTP